MSRFWSAIVADLSPYVPGEQPKRAGLVKLNTNEHPYPPSPAVREAIRAELGEGGAMLGSASGEVRRPGLVLEGCEGQR